ncbi:MAG: 2-oxoacid:acceptor oxidoreductase subunit alpha [Candidatus Cloacimonetes bacterium]|nr:2-oxoacid:acceptor oxidoreductase subunit alpha [Candidatus Cloacimonadota bacterium]
MKRYALKANSKGVLTGTHNLSGNEAIIEGAFAAGCRFLGVYPISPSLEATNRFLQRSGEVDATFVQMEDEISALAAVLGASWTGKKSMSVTSGSGLSNMMEHIGLGIMLQTPCVIVNVQRTGPSLGIPNGVAQGDTMQARWGSHGDYETIVLTPNSPQECFDLTIKAFNFSERFRVPVLLLTDAYIAQKKTPVKIPPTKDLKLISRKLFKGAKNKYLPYKNDKNLVPPMVNVGDGYRFHVTGLTHDERGYPVMTSECQEACVRPLMEKITKYQDEIIEYEEVETDDADVVVISYGATSTVVSKAISLAKKDGIKVGSFRLITIWPFPEKRVRKLAKKIDAFVIPEINFGQIAFEVERCAAGNCNVFFVPILGGALPTPEDICKSIIKASKEKKKIEKLIEL